MSVNSYLCGWYSENSAGHKGDGILQVMQERYSSCMPAQNLVSEKYSIAAQNSEVATDENIKVVITGQPYWKIDELNEYAKNHNHAATVLYAYKNMGMRFLDNLRGRFVFAIYNGYTDQVILGVDRMGQQHCYYAQKGQCLVFASRADAVVAHPFIDAQLDMQSLYNYVYFHAIPSPGSIYKTVKKLQNGEYLVFEKGNVSTFIYWEPEFQETTDAPIEELSEEMLAIIERSVVRAKENTSVGAFLSGGLDSSTVSGMLSKVSKDKAKTFSIGFNAKGYDETEYARTASNWFDTDQTEYYVTPDDVVMQVSNIAAFFDEPFGNSSALPAYFCAKMASDKGVERLLAGDGGDEIFAGNSRYAKQSVFEIYQRIPSILRSFLIEPVFLSNPLASNIPVVKKVNSYITQANIPLPDRLETYNYLHRHTGNEIFDGDFLQAIQQNEPLELLRDTYNRIGNTDATVLNRLMYLDWKRTLHDNDLVKVNRMCEMAGVEAAYPLLDDELVEFSCRIPSHIKLKGNDLRWFYKRAIRGFLPEEIISKTKHGFGLPFGIWTSEHAELQELAYESLKSLKKRGIFRETFIDQTIKMHQSVHAKFYGELVWILMMLELWMDNHSH